MAKNAWADRLATLYELQAKKESHRNPAVWVRDVLGEDMWSMQEQICESVRDNRFTAVQSCHAAGKALSTGTLLPTPTGWLRTGDARTGDIVLDESGKPTRITGISPLWTRQFYRVTFDDGTHIDAGDNHEWNVIDLRHRPRKVADWRAHWDAAVTVETKFMAENLRENGQLRWRIPLAAPLQLPEAALPVDPYALGAWLGDGSANQAAITIGDDKLKIIEELEKAGETPRVTQKSNGAYRVGLVGDLQVRMRALGVLGDKHIPMSYLRASERQRKALLAGLLDTDGCLAKGPGDAAVSIELTNKKLAEGVRELLISLGIKVGCSESEAAYTLDGERHITGTRYRMNFRPLSNPFRVRGKGWTDTTAQRSRVTQRTVVSVEPIGEQTSFCIEVDSPRHLYLAGEGMVPTHNSHLASRLSAWWIATTPMEEVFLVTTAPTARQVASILWRYIQRAHNLAKERGFDLPGQILSSPIPSWKINGELVGIGQKPPDKEDSAFQGFHAEKILVVVDEACHDDRTDVLTEHGWMRFADLTGTERLLTMDPETHEARYTLPAALVKRPYKGPLHVYQARGMDYAVTPDHTMLYGQRQPWKEGAPLDWRKALAGDIATWENKFVKKDITWAVPDDRDLSDDWLAFLGWFGAEGSIDKRVTTVTLTQLPGSQQDEIFDICVRLGLNPKIYGDIQVTVHNSKLARYLEQWGRTQLVRRVPDPVRFASARQIGVYLDAYSAGDGYHKGNGREIIYTSSSRMADDLQELILKTGVPSVVTKRKLAGVSRVMPDGHIATSTVDGYVVSRPASSTHARMRNTNARVEDYDGMVYCATMPRDNLLFTRRNGYTMWSGNCGVDRSIWDAVDSLVTNEASRVLAIGNPTDPASHFRQVCSPESPLGEKWNKIRIDALRSPLMTEEACSRYPRLVEYMRSEGIPFATEEVAPALQKTLVGPTWVYESMVGWGQESSLFKSKVRALFPETSSEGVIPLAWAEAAMARWEQWRDGTYVIDPDTREPLCLAEPRAQQTGELVIGADISDGGEDETVAAVRQGDVVRELVAFASKDPLTTADDLQEIAVKHGAPTNAKYIVDGIGVGSGVVAKLRRDHQDTYAFIAAAQSGRKDTTGKMSFINDRAAAWWNLRELLNPSRRGGAKIALPRDEKLLAELTCPRFDTQPATAKYKIEKKEDIRTRLGRSTDRADAVIHAFWMPGAPVNVEQIADTKWKEPEEKYRENPAADAVVETWDTASDMESAGW